MLVAMLIIAASHRPTLASPDITNIDKLAHFGVYGLLATMTCRLGRGWRGAGWAWLATAAFGAVDEWHQSFVPGRYPELADWVADSSGAALAVVLYAGWRNYRELLELPVVRRKLAPTAARP